MTATDTHQDPVLHSIIDGITANLIVEEVYSYPTKMIGKDINLLLVLLRNKGGQEIIPARALCNVAVAEKPGYRCIVAFPEDVNHKISQGNLRLTLICHPENRVYKNPNVYTGIALPLINYKRRQQKAKQFFEKEMAKLVAFEDGYAFYLGKANHAQAAFMLHQVIEIGFRIAENLLMGKEKISHSLRNHQAYIAPFCTELGGLFEKQHELSILGKLDESYSAARYDHDFSMSAEDLSVAANKSKELLAYLSAFNRDLLDEIQRQQEDVDQEAGKSDVSEQGVVAVQHSEFGKTVENEDRDHEHRNRILTIVEDSFKPTHVFCFAYQSREERLENIVAQGNRGTSVYRYYLVMLTEESVEQPLHKQNQVNDALGGEVEIVALYFKLSTFNRKLADGHPFFHRLKNDTEVWLGDNAAFDHDSVPSTIDLKKRDWQWKRYFWGAEVC